MHILMDIHRFNILYKFTTTTLICICINEIWEFGKMARQSSQTDLEYLSYNMYVHCFYIPAVLLCLYACMKFGGQRLSLMCPLYICYKCIFIRSLFNPHSRINLYCYSIVYTYVHTCVNVCWTWKQSVNERKTTDLVIWISISSLF